MRAGHRVGDENLGESFIDINAVRALVEPIVKRESPEAWASYETEIKPYLEHVDALVTSIRRDGSFDRSQAQVTAR